MFACVIVYVSFMVYYDYQCHFFHSEEENDGRDFVLIRLDCVH